MSCFSFSENLKRLVIFGGCPSSPDETDDGESWEKLSDTILVEVGEDMVCVWYKRERYLKKCVGGT